MEETLQAECSRGCREIDGYQLMIGAWSDYNFGDVPDTGVIGLVEEVGEMCRAYVKRAQGIRGTREEWDAELRKEAADVFIKLAQICHDEKFYLSEAVAERWAIVRQRDWRADRQGHGIPAE
jgi:NTP pyrophosphatase (non-canonical NTP hydrolase)